MKTFCVTTELAFVNSEDIGIAHFKLHKILECFFEIHFQVIVIELKFFVAYDIVKWHLHPLCVLTC